MAMSVNGRGLRWNAGGQIRLLTLLPGCILLLVICLLLGLSHLCCDALRPSTRHLRSRQLLEGLSAVGALHLASRDECLPMSPPPPKEDSSPPTPFQRLAAPPVAIASTAEKAVLASPSILQLPNSTTLLVVYELHNSGNATVATSTDGGVTWAQVGAVQEMHWPQAFSCKSGVYVIGVERDFSRDNNVVISRMLDGSGASWSDPVKITSGLSVVSANTGVDISNGRVTRTFEAIPSMASRLAQALITKEVLLTIEGGPGGLSWQHPPAVRVELQDASSFIQYTLVKVERGAERPLFFRVLEVLPAERALLLRLERFTLYWQQSSVTLLTNWTVVSNSGQNVYGSVDWVAMAMNADESADLTQPSSWAHLDPPLGNPASVYSNELRVLFDIAFRADKQVRESILGFDVPELSKDELAWEAGFGSVYWMEGVVTRLQDRHGGSSRLVSLMRVNNDVLCDLAAVLEFDDTTTGRLRGRFLRYTAVPGLGVGHPAIVYDKESDLYWMASNINRDSTRHWKQPAHADESNPLLHITRFSKCEVDRSTLGLFYSPNLFDWVLAGPIDYHQQLSRHFAYPHMVINGADLLVVSRASLPPGVSGVKNETHWFHNNHNSNAIAFHRVRNFRHYAAQLWALEQGEYSQHPRRTAMEDEL